MTVDTKTLDSVRQGFVRAGLRTALELAPGSWLSHPDPARRQRACEYLLIRVHGAIHWAVTRGAREGLEARRVLDPLVLALEEFEEQCAKEIRSGRIAALVDVQDRALPSSELRLLHHDRDTREVSP